ncbi:PUX7 [Symbiodinium sp. KB8]|nr:PUX7 [Symbiodinium sp. KB8]
MAKAMGQSANKWVIANLQDPSTFECHMLNRDTWKDEGVGALLSEHFMLWQQNHDHADAQRVISLYMLPESVEYPVLLIIDPVTGAELHRSCGMVEPQAMISKLLKFLEQHKAPIPDPAPAQASVGSKGSKRPRSSAGATAVVKQAKAARAALAQAAASSVHHKPAASAEDSEEYLYSSDEEGAASSPSPGVVEDLCSEADSDADVVAVPSKSHQPDALAVEALATATIPKACVLEKEPGKGPESTRIQLRLPDGKRCTAEEAGLAEAITPAAARAALEKPLRPLQAEAFDLRSTFPSASLESSASKSLQDADLLNSSIVVNAR